ncbi:MAG TPA: DUF3617 domain-containing protein [Allosphingosinicella sp.]|nr:DUF3617 domain-containing protein [Allosphingosinicella sp.]
MKTKLILTTAMLALAACGSGGDKAAGNGAAGAGGENATANGTAAASGTETAAATGTPQGGDLKLEPGLYEVKANMGLAGAKGSDTSRTCITKEEVDKANAGMFADKDNKNCTQDGFAFRGGRIQGTITCTGGDTPGKMTLTMNGTYTSTSYEIDQKMSIAMGGANMNVDGHLSAHRIGDCKPGDES